MIINVKINNQVDIKIKKYQKRPKIKQIEAKNVFFTFFSLKSKTHRHFLIAIELSESYKNIYEMWSCGILYIKKVKKNNIFE